jgi:N6-L-threonylcarbamoyladenine synthase
MLHRMLILGIETSCDETSAAVVRDGREVLSCVISSSKNDFTSLGGVIPEDAARKQLESILPVIQLSLEQAKVQLQDIDAIAVTYGPGLLGSLLVGTASARVLSVLWNKPLLPVHHTLGHLSSTWLQKTKDEEVPVFPILTLSVSGGHSDLWYRTSHMQGQRIGTTRDDAAGEAFDKGAMLLGLPYPGGPSLAKLATQGNEKTYEFPNPLHTEKVPDFSFSGLKTSLKYALRDLGDKAASEQVRADLAASYQFAICRHLTTRLSLALDQHPETNEIHIVGGVSANERLRTMITDLAQHSALTVRCPTTLKYCTDNAAMIASAAYYQSKEQASSSEFHTKATSNLSDLLSPSSNLSR